MIYFKKGKYILPQHKYGEFWRGSEKEETIILKDVPNTAELIQRVNKLPEKVKYIEVDYHDVYLPYVIAYLKFLIPNGGLDFHTELFRHLDEYFVNFFGSVYNRGTEYYGVGFLSPRYEFEHNFNTLPTSVFTDRRSDVPFEIMLGRYLYKGMHKEELNEVLKNLYQKDIKSDMKSFHFGLKFFKKYEDYSSKKKEIINSILEDHTSIDKMPRKEVYSVMEDYWEMFGLNPFQMDEVLPENYIDAFIAFETRPGIMKFGKLSTNNFNMTVNSYLVALILENKDNKDFLNSFRL